MTGFDPPVVAWRSASDDPPLVVLLHGDSLETDVMGQAEHLLATIAQ